VNDTGVATEKLLAELVALGLTEAYEVGDGATVSVWIGLVVTFRDGEFRWREGTATRRHPGSDPVGCAARVARRYHELRANPPAWWEELVVHSEKRGPHRLP